MFTHRISSTHSWFQCLPATWKHISYSLPPCITACLFHRGLHLRVPRPRGARGAVQNGLPGCPRCLPATLPTPRHRYVQASVPEQNPGPGSGPGPTRAVCTTSSAPRTAAALGAAAARGPVRHPGWLHHRWVAWTPYKGHKTRGKKSTGPAGTRTQDLLFTRQVL